MLERGMKVDSRTRDSVTIGYHRLPTVRRPGEAGGLTFSLYFSGTVGIRGASASKQRHGLLKVGSLRYRSVKAF
ncbi:hypothetical protein AMTR_s00057p00052360 [Amborella trichopoda]|uniref:Uncharacterized protein n=1 Tax=Amborella trichopoda TaxID=13333 RepID=U5D8P7_AMBTC|nr:hypothetical protein AMTR_s00057p00052360 [Amborella trichopoda]